MNIIFLDIDGVLRTDKSDKDWSVRLNLPIPKRVFDRNFSPKSVSNINYITGLTRSKIVITSTWRTNFNLSELKKIFINQGIVGDVIDITTINGLNRGEEIQEYLDTHDIDNYVVIDDQVDDILKFCSNKRVFRIDHKIGFEDETIVDEIIDILS